MVLMRTFRLRTLTVSIRQPAPPGSRDRSPHVAESLVVLRESFVPAGKPRRASREAKQWIRQPAARGRPESADAPSRQVSLIHSRAFAASAIGYTRPSMGMNIAMNFVVRLIHSKSVTTAKRSQSNM